MNLSALSLCRCAAPRASTLISCPARSCAWPITNEGNQLSMRFFACCMRLGVGIRSNGLHSCIGYRHVWRLGRKRLQSILFGCDSSATYGQVITVTGKTMLNNFAFSRGPPITMAGARWWYAGGLCLGRHQGHGQRALESQPRKIALSTSLSTWKALNPAPCH